MAKRPLRVATADDKPTKPLTLAEAVEGGDYLSILKAQRRQMVTDVADATGPAVAALHRQIALHSKEIASLEIAASEDREGESRGEAADEAFDASAI